MLTTMIFGVWMVILFDLFGMQSAISEMLHWLEIWINRNTT